MKRCGLFALLVIVAGAGVGGCGGATSPGVRTLDAALATRDAARARTTAPDLFAQVSEASARAHAAQSHGDRLAAEDEATTARLFLQAALAETRRADAESAAATAHDAARAARAELASIETERDAIEARATRLAAARAAQDELARALERAHADEPHRGRMVSNDATASREAALALARRARLLLAAATALGASDLETKPATDALAASATALQPDPRAALAAADRARLLAENALGAARSRTEPAPDATSIAELGEAAHAAALTAVATPRGVEVHVPGTPNARVLAELAALITAHPAGPVSVEIETTPTGTRAATQRATRLVASLVALGVPQTRLTPGTTAGGTGTLVVFLAYAPAALAATPTTAPSASPQSGDTGSGAAD